MSHINSQHAISRSGSNLLVHLRGAVIAFGFVASMAAGSLGVIGSAEARMTGDPVTQFGLQCKIYQDAYDDAVRDYHAASTPEELIAARKALNSAQNDWNSFGCNDVFGDIRFLVANPGGHLFDSVIVAGELHPGENDSGPSIKQNFSSRTAGIKN